ncbi:MAG: OmpH family outer membrane protein [Gammaproteobacteria bacterium]|nr:OmpH family outer membrane protein [Gammaproteobacteria bacterium]
MLNVAKVMMASVLLAAMPLVQAEELKIAYVDLQEVMQKSPQAVQANRDLETEFKARAKKINDLETELRALGEKFQRDGVTMTEGKRKEAEDELLKKERAVRWDKSTYQEDFKIRQGELTRKVRDQIIKKIMEISKAEQYDLVLYENVLLSSPRVDITARVLTELNKPADKK